MTRTVKVRVRCGDCVFYHNGQCRRNPPVGSQWSMVRYEDWCGEHTRATDRKTARKLWVKHQVNE